MPARGNGVAFTPMPELESVRDPNLRHLLRSMRSNIRAAHGLDGGGFATRAELEAVASGRQGATASAAAEGSSSSVAKMVRCAYDASAGGSVGTHYLNAVLPANSVLIRSFCVVQESFVGDAGAAMAILAGDGDEEISIFGDSALDPGWADGYHSSNSIGQSASGRARAFKVVVSGGVVSAGRFSFFAEYVAL